MVCTPSRGVVASRMAEAIDQACQSPLVIDRYWTHDDSLPECFNKLVYCSLKTAATHLWFVEEDVVVPPGALDAMLELGTDIAAVDYPIRVREPRPLSSYWVKEEGKEARLLWVSLGCTLIRMAVFHAMARPWFRTDQAVVGIHHGSAYKSWKLALTKRDPEKYGGQDSAFCYRALEAGFTLGEVNPQHMIAEHLDRLEP